MSLYYSNSENHSLNQNVPPQSDQTRIHGHFNNEVGLNINSGHKDIQELVEQTLGENAKQQILQILEKIVLLKPQERLLLYLRMPAGAPETDPLRQPQNPLGTRSEINHTINWVRSHLVHDPNVSIPKQDVYEEYAAYCNNVGIKPLSTADFGKVMKQVFPEIRPRRLGTRGNSRYCYAAMRKATKLEPPSLPFIGTNLQLRNYLKDSTDNNSWTVVKNWAESLTSTTFDTLNDLAKFITTNNMHSMDGMNAKNCWQKKLLQKSAKSLKKKQQQTDNNAIKRRKKKKRKSQSESMDDNAAVGNMDTNINNLSDNTSYSPKPSSSYSDMKGSTFSSDKDTTIKPTYLTCRQMPLNEKTPLLYNPTNFGTDLTVKNEKTIPNNDIIDTSFEVNKPLWSLPPKPVYEDPKQTYFSEFQQTSIMRPPQNSAYLSYNSINEPNISPSCSKKAKFLQIRSEDSPPSPPEVEKDDVTTDIIMPRERVISICNLDKDALDSYLNEGDNSQEPDTELLKYFQSDDGTLTRIQQKNGEKSTVDNDNGQIDKNVIQGPIYQKGLRKYSHQILPNKREVKEINKHKLDPIGNVQQQRIIIGNNSERNSKSVRRKITNVATKQTINKYSSSIRNFTFVPISPGGRTSPKNTQNTFISPNITEHLRSLPSSYKDHLTYPKNYNKSFPSFPGNSLLISTENNNKIYSDSLSNICCKNEISASAPPSPLMLKNNTNFITSIFKQDIKLPGTEDNMGIMECRSQSVPLQFQSTFYHNELQSYSVHNSDNKKYPSTFNYKDVVSSNQKIQNRQHILPPIQIKDPNPHTTNSQMVTNIYPTQSSVSTYSRSVPSTPQPQLSFSFPVNKLALNNPSEISKSVPTTPNVLQCDGTPFSYSPKPNRDYLINGNSIEPTRSTPVIFESGNILKSDELTIPEEICELNEFDDATDPIIGSDVLNSF